MLRQRVITAVLMLAVLVGTLWVDAPWPFLGLLALACGCAAWEWLRLTLPARVRQIGAAAGGVLVFALCAWLIGQWTGPDDMFGRGESVRWIDLSIYAVAAIWVVGVLPAVVRGDATRSGESALWSLFAPVALLTAWVSLALMFLLFSAWFVISLLITVWVADVGAYFVGRAIGKRKLAPRVSPGKTIEGAIAGMTGAVLWLVISGWVWPDSFGATLMQYWTLPGAIVIAAFLGAMSILGDLFESLLKRRAGQKDSSQLLPGHGGVFDRIDAIVPVAVCAQAFLSVGAVWGVA